MFRTLANSSLRRSLHTSSRLSASSRPTRLRAVLGASAVATSYLVWNSWYGQRIALDASAPSSKQVPPPPKTSTSAETINHAPPAQHEHEPFLDPDLQPSPLTPEEAKPGITAEGEESESSGGGGGAFNPETGEINWDCPCLGGMAHGPCGMQFREAFSCFVFSEADPKGIDCVEKFKAMQECFKEHPDVYGEDIMNDDDEEAFALDAVPSPEAITEQPTQPTAAASEPAQSPVEVPSTEQENQPPKASSSPSH